MNTKTLYGLGFLVAIVSSCSTVEQDFKDDALITKEQKEVIISATVESQPETRTVLNSENLSVLWKPADEIKVFSAGEASKFISQNSENKKAVNFLGTISVITGTAEGTDIDTHIYGLYPYTEDATMTDGSFTTTLPSVQTGVAETFDDDLFISIGRSYTFSMGFWNVCSGYRFSFTEGGYQSVTLISNDGTPLAGTFVVTFDDNGKPVITSNPAPSSSVTMNAPEGGFVPNTFYYLVVLPGTHASGLTFTATNASGTGTFAINEEKTLNRSKFKQVVGLDLQLSFGPPVPEAVDLGLSVKWASFNLGATRPEEFGDYYAWGETEPYYSGRNPLIWKEGKDAGYDKASYRWYTLNGSYSYYLTKYCDDSAYGYNGFSDGKTVLDAEDDAAHVILEGYWRMPTHEDQEELRTRCSWELTTQNGVTGHRVTGPNGNSIFLPAAGCWRGTSFIDASVDNYYYHYWSSSLMTTYACDAYALYYLYPSRLDWGSFNREWGLSIRPVSIIPEESITLDNTELAVFVGEETNLVATVLPDNATNTAVCWVSDNPSVATVTTTGTIKGIKPGVATITARTEECGLEASCSVSVSMAIPEAIDLGLSVKWASFNLGSFTPLGNGNHYAWGETEPKSEYEYVWSNYKWCKGSIRTLTKYCGDSTYGYNGFSDGKTVLDAEDDAAHVHLGGNWRMPTYAEMEELLTQCTWEVTSWGDYRIIGPNKNVIYLPAAGEDGYLSSGGYYWSSSADTQNPGYAYDLLFDSDDYYWWHSSYCKGRSIRPVTE